MNHTPFQPHPGAAPATSRRAFSLMEVLLAVFILGIGLIMVATIFPVGADWTRQSTEDSVAQTIAQNAVSVVQHYYSVGGVNSGQLNTLPATATTLQALPGFLNIPPNERSYQFGNANPYPSPNPSACLYYWTALVRVQPGQSAGASRRYDLYILVMRKGSREQIFTPEVLPYGGHFPDSSNSNEVNGVRDSTDLTVATNHIALDHLLEPTLLVAGYKTGTYTANATPLVSGEVPPVGFIGLGETSGTVFRQTVDIANSRANPRPLLAGQNGPTGTPSENVIYAAPADGTSASPLIYVYQTTLSF